LPFPDRAFDLVLATEILEHIPGELYSEVLNELERVADKYLLVTVPNSENLNENSAVCPSCGSRFHIWGHMRSYTPSSLGDLFPAFKAGRIIAFGESVGCYNTLLLWLRQSVAGRWQWENRTICHVCQAVTPPTARWPFLARVCDFLNYRFWAPFFKRRSWLLGLYVRKQQGAS
jgi:hypothetical protein